LVMIVETMLALAGISPITAKTLLEDIFPLIYWELKGQVKQTNSVTGSCLYLKTVCQRLPRAEIDEVGLVTSWMSGSKRRMVLVCINRDAYVFESDWPFARSGLPGD